jgi:tetratricopeptide (TPR) repeat protein
MSNPNSNSSTPEFSAENGYSDILGISMPPRHRQSPEPTALSEQASDPWADAIDEAGAVDAPQLPTAKLSASEAPRAHTSAVSPPIQSHHTNNEPPTPSSRATSTAQTARPPAPPAATPQNTPKVDPASVSVTAKDMALQYCKSGSKSLAAKNYAQARSAYKVAIEWDGGLASAHAGLAEVLYQVQDYDGALVELDLAIRIDRTQLEYYYQRALVSKLLKNYYQVLADCKWILERAPEHPSARWLNAVALVKTENYHIALLNLNQHISTYPQDPNGYCYRGICYERLEQFAEALADLDLAISMQPNQPVFHHARGRARQRLGDMTGALADYSITIVLRTGSANARKPQAAVYQDRAEVNRSLGNHLEALQDCDKALELNPKLIDAYFRRGLTYTELGDLGLALENYNLTLDLDPEHVQAYIQRSWIYFRKEDYKRAKRDCQSAISLDGTCFWANYVLGVVNVLLGLKNNALTNFSRAIELSPHYVSSRYHRGLLYQDLGDMPKAMADFEQARSVQDRGLERLVDRDETGFYAEGLALYHLGQPEAARTILMLGALAAKRFNNPSFHKLIQSSIEGLGVSSGELYCRLIK